MGSEDKASPTKVSEFAPEPRINFPESQIRRSVQAEKFMPQARLLPALGGRERREPHFGTSDSRTAVRGAEPRPSEIPTPSFRISSGLDDEDGLEPHWTSAVRQKAGLGPATLNIFRTTTVSNMQDGDKISITISTVCYAS